MTKLISLFCVFGFLSTQAEAMHKSYYGHQARESREEYFKAVTDNDFVTIEYLLKSKKIDINVTNKRKETALFFAPDEGMAEYLLEKGIDIDAQDEYQRTALFFAQDEKMVKVLVERGIKIDAQSKSGYTALMQMVGSQWLRKKDFEKAKILMRYNAEVDIKDAHGNTALHHLIKGEFNIPKIDVADVFWGAVFLPMTALIYNDRKSESNSVQLKLLDLILKRNPHIDAKNDVGETALHCAVSRSKPKLVERLIAHGADVDALYGDKTSILRHAVKNGSLAIVELLLKKKNSLNFEDQALAYAQEYQKAEIIRLIEDRKRIFARAAACVLF